MSEELASGMIYLLEVPKKSFAGELVDRGLTEARVCIGHRRVDANYTSIAVIATALDKAPGDLVRCVVFQEASMHFNKESLEKVWKEAQKAFEEFSKTLEERGLAVKEGEWLIT